MAMRESFLPFTLPDIDGEELKEIRGVLESGWMTTGPKVKQFEAEFARLCGRESCDCRELVHGGDASRSRGRRSRSGG